MLEIRISNTAAVQLLVDRIESEFKARKRYGLYHKKLIIEDLPFSELFEITEIAAYDLASLLPFDIYIKETNIASIISKAIQSLVTVFQKSEFAFYTDEMAENLIKSIKRNHHLAEEKKVYLKN